MVIFKDMDALTLSAKAGIKFLISFINIEGMRFKAGRVQITQTVSVAPFEIDNFIYLHVLGYKIEF